MNEQARNTRCFFLFILPWIIGFLVFTMGPLLVSLYLSFTTYPVTEPPRWAGLHNYDILFKSWEPNFYNSIKVTIAYSIIAVPLTIIIALAAALLLNIEGIRFLGVFRTLYFLPSLLPAVAATIVWAWVFHPKFGCLNIMYKTLFGEQGPDWLQDPQLALGCLIIMAVWGFGNTMMIFLAGLQDVPRALLEAAHVDGASVWERFRHVTIPAISPVIFFNIVMGIIGSLQVFTQAFVFANSSAAVNRKAVHFYLLNIYDNAFAQGHFGRACAMAWLLMAAILVLTLIQFYFKRKWVVYND